MKVKIVAVAEVLIDVNIENAKQFKIENFKMEVLDEDGNSIPSATELNDIKAHIINKLIDKEEA